MFRHYLPILRRHYTNANLVTIVCGWSRDVGRYQCSHIPRPNHIYNRTQWSPNLRSCSASWRWASNSRNMLRLWSLIKCKWRWSVYRQVGCVYYVITSIWCTFNKTLISYSYFTYQKERIQNLCKINIFIKNEAGSLVWTVSGFYMFQCIYGGYGILPTRLMFSEISHGSRSWCQNYMSHSLLLVQSFRRFQFRHYAALWI
jgi:hypothetical protein